MNMTPWEILGLEESATMEEVKAKYLQLCKECHPDLHDGDKAKEAWFKQVKNAYETIKSDHEKVQNATTSTTEKASKTSQNQTQNHESYRSLYVQSWWEKIIDKLYFFSKDKRSYWPWYYRLLFMLIYVPFRIILGIIGIPILAGLLFLYGTAYLATFISGFIFWGLAALLGLGVIFMMFSLPWSWTNIKGLLILVAFGGFLASAPLFIAAVPAIISLIAYVFIKLVYSIELDFLAVD